MGVSMREEERERIRLTLTVCCAHTAVASCSSVTGLCGLKGQEGNRLRNRSWSTSWRRVGVRHGNAARSSGCESRLGKG